MKEYTVKVYDNKTEWFREGKLDRETGPAVEYTNGDKHWYREGKLHRADGPALEYANGSKYWYREDKQHRDSGPAVEYANGTKYWYLEGIEYTEEQYREKMNPGSSCEGKVVEIDGIQYKLTAV